MAHNPAEKPGQITNSYIYGREVEIIPIHGVVVSTEKNGNYLFS
jgi:hypothetical protein